MRLGGEAAVVVEHTGAQCAEVGVLAGKGEGLVQRVFAQQGVGVEEEDVFATGLCQGKVVGAAETQVFLRVDKA